MGRTHATSGAVLALAVLPAAPALGMDISNPATIGMYLVAAAAGGVAPDADHHSASVAWSLPPLSRWVCRGVGLVSGGHRNGTHSLIGIAAAGGLAWMLQNAEHLLAATGIPDGRATTIGQIVLGVWLAFLVSTATTSLRVSPPVHRIAWSLICLAAGVLVATGTVAFSVPVDPIPIAFTIGAAAHVLGDMLTKEGCPLLWPVSKFRFRVAGITTDTWPERLIVGPALGVIAVALAYAQLPHQWTDPVRQLLADSGSLLSQLKGAVSR